MNSSRVSEDRGRGEVGVGGGGERWGGSYAGFHRDLSR